MQRHATSAHVGLRLAIKRNGLKLSIHDDDFGFDGSHSRNIRCGVSACALRVRIENIGGPLCVQSQLAMVLMDISMNAVNGAELTSMLQQSAPQLAVLMLSMHDNAEYAKLSFEAGAGAGASFAFKPGVCPTWASLAVKSSCQIRAANGAEPRQPRSEQSPESTASRRQGGVLTGRSRAVPSAQSWRRRRAIRPAKAIPSSASEAGSGTALPGSTKPVAIVTQSPLKLLAAPSVWSAKKPLAVQNAGL